MTQYVEEKVERIEHPITSWALLAVIVCMVFAYAGFINATISNIVSTKDMQVRVGALTTSVSSLESSYLAAKSTITLEGALAQGFVPSKSDAVYISRASAGSLSFNR